MRFHEDGLANALHEEACERRGVDVLRGRAIIVVVRMDVGRVDGLLHAEEMPVGGRADILRPLQYSSDLCGDAHCVAVHLGAEGVVQGG
jgi:hypothetical protein